MAAPNLVVFQQTDGVAGCGAIQACAGSSPASGAAGRTCVEGGAAGSSEFTVSVPAAKAAMCMWQMSRMGTVLAGDWDISINVTTAGANVEWQETHICLRDAACNAVATLGSKTGQSISLGTTGVKTMTVTSAFRHLQPGELIYIVCVARYGLFGIKNVGITPDQTINSTLVPATARLRRLIERY